MSPVSRPLRALGVTLGGWTTMRIVALWPVSGVAVEARAIDTPLTLPPRPVVAMPLDDDVPLFAKQPLSSRGMNALARAQAHRTALVQKMAGLSVASNTAEPSRDIAAMPLPDAPVEAQSAIAPGLPPTNPRNRFSGSAWALMRSDGAPSLASGGQLGGSQIGMRLFFTPGPDALAITARVSAPLAQPAGREAAIGIALRGRNVGLIAEQRFALDKGGRDAPAIFAYGGVSDVKLPGGLRLDGYAQAGVVGIKNPAAFIDGAVRVERTIVTAERASLGIGGGAWGGAQPGASRIDVGPQIVAHIATAKTNLRVSAEWRQRVAGNAAPPSGPSVTIGFDF
jgi:hypothetical protein